jgi:hypothetical protein
MWLRPVGDLLLLMGKIRRARRVIIRGGGAMFVAVVVFVVMENFSILYSGV